MRVICEWFRKLFTNLRHMCQANYVHRQPEDSFEGKPESRTSCLQTACHFEKKKLLVLSKKTLRNCEWNRRRRNDVSIKLDSFRRIRICDSNWVCGSSKSLKKSSTRHCTYYLTDHFLFGGFNRRQAAQKNHYEFPYRYRIVLCCVENDYRKSIRIVISCYTRMFKF